MKVFKMSFVLAAIVVMAACRDLPPEALLPDNIQQPNPVPPHALLKRIYYTGNNHYSMAYGAQNQLTRMLYQWQYDPEDTTSIRTLVYDFQYDAAQKLIGLKYSGGFSLRYFYKGSLIDSIMEYYPGGDWQASYRYGYTAGRISHVLRTVAGIGGELPTRYRYTFDYDDHGNLCSITTSEQLPDGQYQWFKTEEYLDFDNGLNTANWLQHYPYLPQVRWQFNNPRRMRTRTRDLEEVILQNEYRYDALGRPVSVTTTRQGMVTDSLICQYD